MPLVVFPPFFTWNSFGDIVSFIVHRLLPKWVYSKRKDFAPNGSKFFPSRADPFQNEAKSNLIELPPTESVKQRKKY